MFSLMERKGTSNTKTEKTDIRMLSESNGADGKMETNKRQADEYMDIHVNRQTE